MKLAVLGGGSWGTALAAHLARSGHATSLWLREGAVAERINSTRENPRYLPGIALPPFLATTDLGLAVEGASVVLVVIPSQFCREIYARLRGVVAPGAVLVSATKGLEIDTLERMSQVAATELPGQPLAVLSGPSFALEVAQGQPTTVVVAAQDHAVAELVQRAVSSRAFRAYSSEDVVGVELAGSLKNVIAIAAGIVSGLGYGHNTLSALITRGLAEMTRLSVAEGGRADTLAGLAGLGDLVLTCTGALSRNRRLGQALGEGQKLEDVVTGTSMVAEGVRTTAATCVLAAQRGIEMPIAQEMRAVLYEGRPPAEAVDTLMLRSLKRE